MRLYNDVTGVKEDGFVQICKSGRWYSVCGSDWDCRDGNVACRELGYDQASKPYKGKFYFESIIVLVVNFAQIGG